MAGHIKLDRKITEWEWYTDANVSRLFIHLLLMANYKDGKWKGVPILRGQVVIGRKALADDLHLSEQQIRTALDKLSTTKEITTESTNKFTIVTICKYDTYQTFNDDISVQITNSLTNNQPTNNQQITTSNKNNKLIKKENTSFVSPTGGVFWGLYEKMMMTYSKYYPTYYKEDKDDYPACNVIADKIEKLKGWKHGSCMNGNMDVFLEEWDKMTKRLTSNDWLDRMTLKDLSDREWQRWCKSMSNQEKGITSKDPKPKEEKKESILVSAKTLASQYD
jgi:hypothetical protein